jgi:hypothetical protein
MNAKRTLGGERQNLILSSRSNAQSWRSEGEWGLEPRLGSTNPWIWEGRWGSGGAWHLQACQQQGGPAWDNIRRTSEEWQQRFIPPRVSVLSIFWKQERPARGFPTDSEGCEVAPSPRPCGLLAFAPFRHHPWICSDTHIPIVLVGKSQFAKTIWGIS